MHIARKILIVEDEILVAVSLKKTLEFYGYNVPAIAVSGEEAINFVKNYHPDIVLMDITLKGRMDGIEAAEHISNQFDIPIIFITAHSSKDIIEKAKKVKHFGYITKPFNERHLSNVINMALNKFQTDL